MDHNNILLHYVSLSSAVILRVINGFYTVAT